MLASGHAFGCRVCSTNRDTGWGQVVCGASYTTRPFRHPHTPHLYLRLALCMQFLARDNTLSCLDKPVGEIRQAQLELTTVSGRP